MNEEIDLISFLLFPRAAPAIDSKMFWSIAVEEGQRQPTNSSIIIQKLNFWLIGLIELLTPPSANTTIKLRKATREFDWLSCWLAAQRWALLGSPLSWLGSGRNKSNFISFHLIYFFPQPTSLSFQSTNQLTLFFQLIQLPHHQFHSIQLIGVAELMKESSWLKKDKKIF